MVIKAIRFGWGSCVQASHEFLGLFNRIWLWCNGLALNLIKIAWSSSVIITHAFRGQPLLNRSMWKFTLLHWIPCASMVRNVSLVVLTSRSIYYKLYRLCQSIPTMWSCNQRKNQWRKRWRDQKIFKLWCWCDHPYNSCNFVPVHVISRTIVLVNFNQHFLEISNNRIVSCLPWKWLPALAKHLGNL